MRIERNRYGVGVSFNRQPAEVADKAAAGAAGHILGVEAEQRSLEPVLRQIDPQIVKRSNRAQGFEVLPKRCSFKQRLKELENDKKKNANLAELEMLSDVLELVPAPSGCAGRTLKEYVEGLLCAFRSDLTASPSGKRYLTISPVGPGEGALTLT